MTISTREDWLDAASLDLRAALADRGFASATMTHVSCGWPHKLGLARKNRRVGECWNPESSTAGVSEIFISPLLSDSLEVLATLAHELVHALVGTDCGHKGAFIKGVRAIGLKGKPTCTEAGGAFIPIADAIIERLGKYPHAAMSAEGVDKEKKKVKQGTRMLKCECPACGYTVRATAKWLAVGFPICPVDKVAMSGDVPEDERDEGDDDE